MIDSYIQAGYLYDTIWSTRRARSTYSGPCMRVRRSSDNIARDFSFVGDDLDTAGILAFCGSSTGYVDMWYDQSPTQAIRNMMKFSSTGLNVGTYRYWINNSNSSSTFGGDVAPDGSVTATRQNYTSTTGTAIVYTSFFATDINTDYTFSVYAKAGTSAQLALRIWNSNQTVIIVEEPKDLTSDWVRYSITFNTGIYNYISVAIRNGYVNAGNMYLWGPQLEKGSVMTEFEPTEFKSSTGFDLPGYGTTRPTICNAGVMNTVNGKPAIYLAGVNQYFLYFQYFGIFNRSDFYLRPIDPGSADQNSWSTYIVTKPTRLSFASVQCLYGSDYNQSGQVRIGTFANIDSTNIPYGTLFNGTGGFLGAPLGPSALTGNNQIISNYRTKEAGTVYLNGVAGPVFPTAASSEQSGYYGIGCRIRATGNTEFYQGYIQEVAHYCGNLQATRTDYELAARTYYSI